MNVPDLSPDEVASFAGRLHAHTSSNMQPSTGATDMLHMGRVMAYLLSHPAKARSMVPLSDEMLMSTLQALIQSSGMRQ
jgi:hypothetical protein